MPDRRGRRNRRRDAAGTAGATGGGGSSGNAGTSGGGGSIAGTTGAGGTSRDGAVRTAAPAPGGGVAGTGRSTGGQRRRSGGRRGRAAAARQARPGAAAPPAAPAPAARRDAAAPAGAGGGGGRGRARRHHRRRRHRRQRRGAAARAPAAAAPAAAVRRSARCRTTPATDSFTWYNFAQGTARDGNGYRTACGYYGTANGTVDTVENIASTSPAAATYFAAVPGRTASTSNSHCGECVEITGQNGTQIIATVIDECPYGSDGGNTACQANAGGHLDLSKTAFDRLGYPVGNPSNTNWSYVPCPVSGNVKVRFKSGNNNEFFVENVITPIASVTVNGTTPAPVIRRVAHRPGDHDAARRWI